MSKLIFISMCFICLSMGPPCPSPPCGGGNGGGPPPGGGGGQPCWPAPCVPIDGGIVFLLIVALGYGAYTSTVGVDVMEQLQSKKLNQNKDEDEK